MNRKHIILLLAVLMMVVFGGCGSNQEQNTFESEEAAVEAYLMDDGNLAGGFVIEDTKYYLISEVPEKDSIKVHVAVLKEDGRYQCEKYSPDFTLEKTKANEDEASYCSMEIEGRYLNFGWLYSPEDWVQVQGKSVPVTEEGIFYQVNDTENVIFNVISP